MRPRDIFAPVAYGLLLGTAGVLAWTVWGLTAPFGAMPVERLTPLPAAPPALECHLIRCARVGT